MRLDCFITQKYTHITRQKALELIKQAQVSVNGKIILKSAFNVNDTDSIHIKQDFFIESEIFCSRAALKLQRFLHNTESSVYYSVFYNPLLLTKENSFLSYLTQDLVIWQKAHDSIKHNMESSLKIYITTSLKEILPLMIKDSIILDVGASAGGFSQVLLTYKPKLIVAQDIGSLQLDSNLSKRDEIVSIENVDIRIFSQDFHIYKDKILERIKDSKHRALKENLFDFLVCDVSFISLENILESLLNLSKTMLLLYKPQYEVGIQAKRNKKGVIKDTKIILACLESFLALLKAKNALYIFVEKSLLAGKEGNEEFFIFCQF
ncbi:MAG: SAM-dependent methyltransferase [Helicobacter sp.]|uniref:SAM-dependent methyltransferase n=1 Tax=Helicobacter sp. TaxID=218 RepID=UPI002A91652D|nr:SAM-dependent methyltransferase [Helicobacter sp.]MDY5822133.1 SAM-dependent methyltransferase [Helicobacter sp.]